MGARVRHAQYTLRGGNRNSLCHQTVNLHDRCVANVQPSII